MKILFVFLVFCALIFTNCQKSSSNAEEIDVRVIKTAPFEDSQFKIERVSVNLPDATTKIHFFDQSNGICLTGGNKYGVFYNQGTEHTTGGSIYITNNGGSTWTPSYTFSKASSGCLRPLGFEITEDNTIVAFASSAVCHSSDPDVRTNVVIQSTDKGQTWVKNALDNTRLSAMTYGEDNTLYAIGGGTSHEGNSIFESKDNGTNWKRTAISTSFGSMTNIMTLSDKKLLIRGSYFDTTNPQLLSVNNGLNWQKQSGNEYMLGVSKDEKMGLYLSEINGKYEFKVQQSHNDGATWSTIRTFQSTINEVKVVSATTALILGRSDGELNAGFSYTTDGGKTWTDKTLLDNGHAGELVASSFYSSKSGYIVGANKILYRITFKQ
jgi:photosystem II stability/assembly factor-like uncharacterized protein